MRGRPVATCQSVPRWPIADRHKVSHAQTHRLCVRVCVHVRVPVLVRLRVQVQARVRVRARANMRHSGGEGAAGATSYPRVKCWLLEQQGILSTHVHCSTQAQCGHSTTIYRI